MGQAQEQKDKGAGWRINKIQAYKSNTLLKRSSGERKNLGCGYGFFDCHDQIEVTSPENCRGRKRRAVTTGRC